MHAKTLGMLVATAALLGGAVPALAQMQPAPPPPAGAMEPQATSPMAPPVATRGRHMMRRGPHMSCAARLSEIRAAWEQMPASDTKNQVAAAYNQANHAHRAGDERGCLAAVAQIQLAH